MQSRIDPSLYFQSYQRQMRVHAAQIAAGEPDTEQRNPVRLPRYYAHPEMGSLIGSHFQMGLPVSDPIGNAQSMTFLAAFESPYNAQLAEARNIARIAAQPLHQNLETPSGKATKSRLDLPYQSHSIIDTFKASQFFSKVARAFDRSQSVTSSVIESQIDSVSRRTRFQVNRLRPIQSVHISNSAHLNSLVEHDRVLVESYFSSRLSQIEAGIPPGSIAEGLKAHLGRDYIHAWHGTQARNLTGISRSGLSISAPGDDGKIFFTQNEAVLSSYENTDRLGTLRGDSSKDIRPLRLTARLPIENLSTYRGYEIIHRGPVPFDKISVPVSKARVGYRRSVTRYSPDAVPKHQNLESRSGQDLKARLDLPYQEHSIVDILKSARFMRKVSGVFKELLSSDVQGELPAANIIRNNSNRFARPSKELRLDPVTTAEFSHKKSGWRQIGGFQPSRADTGEADQRAIYSYFSGQKQLVDKGIRTGYQEDIKAGMRTALGRDYINLYHGVPGEHLESIKQLGLLALPPHINPETEGFGRINTITGKNSASGWKGVYVTSRSDVAYAYAKGRTGGSSTENPIVLRAKIGLDRIIRTENYGTIRDFTSYDLTLKPGHAASYMKDIGAMDEFAVLGDIAPHELILPTEEVGARAARHYYDSFAKNSRGNIAYRKLIFNSELNDLKKSLDHDHKKLELAKQIIEFHEGTRTEMTVPTHWDVSDEKIRSGAVPSLRRELIDLQLNINETKRKLANPEEYKKEFLFPSRNQYLEDSGKAKYHRRLEKQAAVPQHTNLESPTGQFLKEQMGLPYQEQSALDPLKAAGFTALRHIRRVFSTPAADEVISNRMHKVLDHPFTTRVLDATEGLHTRIQDNVRAAVAKSPKMQAVAENLATAQEFYKTNSSPFVQAYGKIQGTLGEVLGGSVKSTGKKLSPEKMKYSEFMLHNVVGPTLLLGLQVVPLLYEIRHKLREHTEAGEDEAQKNARTHNNLETPSGQMLKAVLGLPYKRHSQVDPLAAAQNFWSHVKQAYNQFQESIPDAGVDEELDPHFRAHSFRKVKTIFDDLERQYPRTIGQGRQLLRHFYELQTEAYAYFAQHKNPYLSAVARSLLYAESVEHKIDYSYRLSPTRFVGRLVRSAVGVEKRHYESLALHGLEAAEHAGLRRGVKVAGVAIGVIETILRYEHTIHELREWKQRLFPTQDPEESWGRRLDKLRRKEYVQAKRRGESYDATRVARSTSREPGFFRQLASEIKEQFSVTHQAESFVDAFHHPRQRKASLVAYATFAGLTAHQIHHAWTHTTEVEGWDRFVQMTEHLFKTHAARMQWSAAAFGITGLLTKGTYTAKAGALANLGATFGADIIGKRLGEKFIETDTGRRWAAQAFQQIANLPTFLEITNPKVISWAGRYTEYSAALARTTATTEAEQEALRIARTVAGRVGMEVAGAVLEGTLLVPLRKALQRAGHTLDRQQVLHRAKKKARAAYQAQKSTNQEALQDFLAAQRTNAYSEQDLLLNPHYSTPVRVVGLAARRSDTWKPLVEQLSAFVSPWRRFHTAVQAARHWRENPGKHKVDWRTRLYYAKVAPAFSDADITRNPEYTNAQRVALVLLKRNANGDALLTKASDPVTHLREAESWIEGVTHPQEHLHHLGQTLQRTAGHHIRKAVHHTPVLGPVSDSVSHLQDAGDQAVQSVRHATGTVRHKLKIRHHTRSKDAPLDERQLHAAYSRYINYGHEGRTLNSDQSDL